MLKTIIDNKKILVIFLIAIIMIFVGLSVLLLIPKEELDNKPNDETNNNTDNVVSNEQLYSMYVEINPLIYLEYKVECTIDDKETNCSEPLVTKY